MKYSIRVNEVKGKNGEKNQDSSLRGFATVVFGDSFKITNIAILENKDKNQLFVSMPRYKSNEIDANGGTVYKDVCNPITAEFREELYSNILEAFANLEKQQEEVKAQNKNIEAPSFSVTVTPFEREGSNIRGLARIYFEDSFIVNNVNILQGKDKVFVYRSGKAQPVEITVGLRTEEKVQVLRGLSVGDTLITSGTLQLRTGLPVVLDHIDE